MEMIQIVPALPPTLNGLGDYALNLAQQLRQDFGVVSRFVVGSPSWCGEDNLEGFRVVRVKERSPRALGEVLGGEQRVLLHYVGYGYAQRGYPRWLYEGLQSWHRQSQGLLMVMFHEVYPYHSKPPWTSSFWLAPWQKRLAGALVRLSDRPLTSKESYALLLQEMSGGKHPQIPSLPVFSNIGEPDFIPPLGKRQPWLIVFGHPNSRTLVYTQSLNLLIKVCRDLEIVKVIDIGVPTGLNLPLVNGLEVMELGVRPAAEISSLMLEAIAGFLSFITPDYLAKSGVFAAYCAHGLIPILTSPCDTLTDGLLMGKHYWVADTEKLSLATGQLIQSAAHAWYQQHCLTVQAKFIAHYAGL